MARLKDRPAENPATAPEIRFIAAIRLQRKAKQVPMRKSLDGENNRRTNSQSSFAFSFFGLPPLGVET